MRVVVMLEGIRKATVKDKEECSALIYDSAPHIYKFLTKGSRFVGQEYIIINLKHSIGSYSYDNILLEESDNKIRGLLLSYPTTEICNMKKPTEAYNVELQGLIGLLRSIRLKVIKLSNKYKPKSNVEYFISSIAVFENYQGQGICLKLLKQAEEICREKKIKTLSICVTVNNDKAFKIYEKFGFKEVERITFPKRYEKYDMHGFKKMVKILE